MGDKRSSVQGPAGWSKVFRLFFLVCGTAQGRDCREDRGKNKSVLGKDEAGVESKLPFKHICPGQSWKSRAVGPGLGVAMVMLLFRVGRNILLMDRLSVGCASTQNGTSQ